MEEQIIGLLNAKFEEEEYHDVFLVDMKFNAPQKKLEIFLDSDSGLNLRKCTRINKYLQKHIDENEWLGEKYVLDVSSPGLDRPLKLKRQYIKNIGRTLRIFLKAEDTKKKIDGILKRVEENTVILERKVRKKVGKKKLDEIVEVEIAFDAIEKAIVRATF